VLKESYDGVRMPITDFLDNVPPIPPGFIPYTPPPIQQQIPIVEGNGNGAENGNGETPPGQFPPIPDNIFGFIMIMMGI